MLCFVLLVEICFICHQLQCSCVHVCTVHNRCVFAKLCSFMAFIAHGGQIIQKKCFKSCVFFKVIFIFSFVIFCFFSNVCFEADNITDFFSYSCFYVSNCLVLSVCSEIWNDESCGICNE